MDRSALLFVCVAAALASSGCDVDPSQIFGTGSSGETGGAGGTGGFPAGGGGSSQGGGGTSTSVTTTTTTTTGTGGDCDPSNPNGDQDMDGYTPAQGDCNDCDPEINPNAIEVLGGPDEDCSGSLDDVPATCDDAIALDSDSAYDAAYAMDICKKSMGDKNWGISAVAWSLPDGAPVPAGEEQDFHLGHGNLAGFGPQVPPRAGKKLLALSGGTARAPGDPGYQSPQGFTKGYGSAHAPGFPKETAACGGATTGSANDATVLNVAFRVPSNVHGFSFDASFYAFDFPGYVCSTFNDTYFALFEPKLAGQPDTNVAYDELGNPLTLNGANFRACSCQNGPPCSAGNKMYSCSLGDLPLLGTGFEGHGATGWITTTVPVEPGANISMRWGVYDAGDSAFDSTVLLDNWKWLTEKNVVYGTTIAP